MRLSGITNELAAYSMILLRHENRFLMLERGAHKSFAPGRWTGIGGRVETDEFSDLKAAALRELQEETGIPTSDVKRFSLRRALLSLRPGSPLTVLLYFTGELDDPVIPFCDEGTLHWLTADELSRIDIIENTREVIPLLIDDMQSNPEGAHRVNTGATDYAADGSLRAIVWAG